MSFPLVKGSLLAATSQSGQTGSRGDCRRDGNDSMKCCYRCRTGTPRLRPFTSQWSLRDANRETREGKRRRPRLPSAPPGGPPAPAPHRPRPRPPGAAMRRGCMAAWPPPARSPLPPAGRTGGPSAERADPGRPPAGWQGARRPRNGCGILPRASLGFCGSSETRRGNTCP